MVSYCAKARWQVQVEVTKLLSAPAVANVIGDSSSRMERKKEKDTAPENGSRPAFFHVYRHFHNFWSNGLLCICFFVKIQINKLLDFVIKLGLEPKKSKCKKILVELSNHKFKI